MPGRKLLWGRASFHLKSHFLMKRYAYLLFVSLFLLGACAEEYEFYNPEPALDAPYFILSASDTALLNTGTSILTVNVVDAPGGIDSVVISVEEDFGSATVDQASFDAVKGQEKASFQVNYTPPNNEGDVDITVRLFDGQAADNQKFYEATITLEVTFACEGVDLSGTYNAENCGGGTNTPTVTGGSGTFTISDFTGGLIGTDVPIDITCGGENFSANAVTVDTFTFAAIGGSVDPDGYFFLTYTVSTPNTGSDNCFTEFFPQ
jgi:hypothetical protein